MSNQKLKVIYTLKIHVALQKQGFTYITEMRNPRYPQFNCWVYEETPELLAALEALSGEACNYD